MKTCYLCEREKNDDQFYESKPTRCRTCIVAQNGKWKRKNRKKYLDYQDQYRKTKGKTKRLARFDWMDGIKSKPCLDCHQKFPPECMDFDHRDPSTKDFGVSQAAVSGYSIERVQREISKCDLVCANCHRIRTARQQNRRA